MSFEVWSTREWHTGRGKTPSDAVWNAFFVAHQHNELHVQTLRPGYHELRGPGYGRGAWLAVHEDGRHATYTGAAAIGVHDQRRRLDWMMAGKVVMKSLPVNGRYEGLEDVLVTAIHCGRDWDGSHAVTAPSLVRYIPTTGLFNAIGLAILHGIPPERMALPKLDQVL